MRTSITILAIAGGVVLLVLLGVAIAVWTVDPNQFIGPIQARVRAATGRELTVGAGIGLKLGLEPRLVINDVHLSNAPWAKGPDLVAAKRIEAEIALLPLLQRRFELIRLNLVEPVISLETNAQGVGNWEVLQEKGAPAPATAASGPVGLGIGNFTITNGLLGFRDGATGGETAVVIDELAMQARDAQSPINAEFRGTIDGVAMALTGSLGPLATWSERRLPYPLAIQGEVAGRKTAVSTKVQRAEGVVELQDLDATAGASNVKGKIDIRRDGQRTTYTVNLASQELSVADLALAGAAAPPTKRPAAPAAPSHYLFADTPFPFGALKSGNANGEVTIDKLMLAGGRSLGNVYVRFTLRDGRLDAPAFRASAYGGTISAKLNIDVTREQKPSIALVLDGHQLDLAALLAVADVKREVRGGKTEIAIDVRMHGDSPRQWVSGVSGNVRAVVGPATLVNSKLDPGQAFDQLAQLVNPFRTVEPSTELHCAVVRFPLESGVAQVDRSIALETKELEVSTSGTLDFRNETLDLSIRPRVRQGIPINIPQIAELVRLHGPFASPTVGVDAMASATAIARIGAAIGTGGLSILGETLLAGAAGGEAGACAVALGKAPSAPATSSAAAKGGATPNPVEDLGKAVGRLLGR